MKLYKSLFCMGYKIPTDINNMLDKFLESPQTKLIFRYPGGSIWIFQSILEKMPPRYNKQFWDHIDKVSGGAIHMEIKECTPTDLCTLGNPHYYSLSDGDLLDIAAFNAVSQRIEVKPTYLVQASGSVLYVVPYDNPSPNERHPLRMVIKQEVIAYAYRNGSRIHKNPMMMRL